MIAAEVVWVLGGSCLIGSVCAQQRTTQHFCMTLQLHGKILYYGTFMQLWIPFCFKIIISLMLQLFQTPWAFSAC